MSSGHPEDIHRNCRCHRDLARKGPVEEVWGWEVCLYCQRYEKVLDIGTVDVVIPVRGVGINSTTIALQCGHTKQVNYRRSLR